MDASPTFEQFAKSIDHLSKADIAAKARKDFGLELDGRASKTDLVRAVYGKLFPSAEKALDNLETRTAAHTHAVPAMTVEQAAAAHTHTVLSPSEIPPPPTLEPEIPVDLADDVEPPGCSATIAHREVRFPRYRVSTRDGLPFRRCGLEFGAHPRVLENLAPDVLSRLEAERALVVEVL